MSVVERASTESRIQPLAAPDLATIALARFAPADPGEVPEPEAQWLCSRRGSLLASALDPGTAYDWWLRMPPSTDRLLHRLVEALSLSRPESLALALALAADGDPLAARALVWLQSPRRDPHPTLGLIARLEEFQGAPAATTFSRLLDGAGLASGLLVLDRTAPGLPDAGLGIPLPLVTALLGGKGHWPGVNLSDDEPDCPPAARAEAQARAQLPAADLVVRSTDCVEAQAVCRLIARSQGRPAALIASEVPRGLGPWLTLHDAMPVICARAAPGERRSIPTIDGYLGAVLVATGIDGGWERDGQTAASWTVPMPSVAERTESWRRRGFDRDCAGSLARSYRMSDARSRQLACKAEAVRQSDGETMLTVRHVARAARLSGRGLLGTLAEPLTEDIADEALILPEPLRADLVALAARCHVRDGLATDLGAAAQARYRPGVRGLFVGPSGTGKTLACGWLATRLGLPLYRVDMAMVSSKYIGETEKHLGELFARAESENVVLLFDEADALFGKRTEVKDAHDRYANQQTNYLLQRIEAHDGIVLLTSNSRSRFDSAFTRRLDAIVEFPQPQPEERRSLWLAHLGKAHAIAMADLNRLAAACELAGGHIRNIVLAARALSPDAPIAWPALANALAAEYRKLGKPVPSAFGATRAR